MAVSDERLRTALALAEALTAADLETTVAASEGYNERFDLWFRHLPPVERLGIQALLTGLEWLPRFSLRGGALSQMAPEARVAWARAITSQIGSARHHLLRAAAMAVLPSFYAAPRLRDRMGDRTDELVATSSRTFPVTPLASIPEASIEADVIIVGSGAGGAPLAWALADRGLRVVVLEEGAYRPATSFPGPPLQAMAELYRDGGATFALGKAPIALPLGRVVGGTTVVNSGTCFRIPGFIHRKWTRDLGMPESISEEGLAPYYEELEEALPVRPVPASTMGTNNSILRRATERLGWSGFPLRRNADGCEGSNRCAFGCPTDGKRAMHVSFLPRAVARGATVVCDAEVRRVLTRGGRAVGVEVARKEGGTLTIHAPRVVIAAGTIGTPPLLWASGLRHRNLGRRLTIHPALKISGHFPKQNVFAPPAVPQSWCIDQFHEQGFLMEGAHVPPDLAVLALAGRSPDEVHEVMDQAREMVTYGFLISDRPSGWLQRGFGRRPLIRYDMHDADVSVAVLGLQKVAELLLEAGARRLYLPTPLMPALDWFEDPVKRIREAGLRAQDLEMAAFHPLGTCGFGPDPETFPLDTDLAFRGVDGLSVCDGSIFPSSLAVNPQLSIMAMALRLADHLAPKDELATAR